MIKKIWGRIIFIYFLVLSMCLREDKVGIVGSILLVGIDIVIEEEFCLVVRFF